MSYRILVLSGILAGFATVSVDATVRRHIDFNTLVAKANAIAHGRVVETRTMDTDDRSKIQTVVRLEVATYLKGDLGPEIAFVVPGGTLGRYRAVVVGEPEFSEGEEVVLFLTARAPAIPRLVGSGQGVFRVSVDSRSGARTISRVPVLSTPLSTRPFARGSAANPPMSLASFGGLVRSIMEQPQ